METQTPQVAINPEIKKEKMPVGMIILSVFLGYTIFGLIFVIIRFSLQYQLGPILLDGVSAFILYILLFAVVWAIFVGILKRFKWARKLGIGYFIFSITLEAINTFSFFMNPTMYDSYYQRTLSPQALAMITPIFMKITLITGFVFGWAVGITIIIYLFRKKSFFVR